MLALSAFIGGLVIGPWLGILVDRVVPRARLAPEHRCVSCATGLSARSLLPVANWFLACAACQRRQFRRYPPVDVATAALFALLAVRFEWSWMLGPYLAVAAVLVVLSAIDIETHLLPNRVMWPAILGGLFVVLVMSGQLDNQEGLRSALLGAAIFGGFIGAAHLAYEHGMGRGDVKLSVLLGLFVGWTEPNALMATRLVLYAIVLALLGGGVVGLVYNTVRRRGRTEIPFGPALAVSAMAVILVSGALSGS